MPKPRYFLELRYALAKAGYDQKSLAPRIKRSESYVNCRFRLIYEWELEDMYRIMDLIKVPYESMATLFPRYGGKKVAVLSGRKIG